MSPNPHMKFSHLNARIRLDVVHEVESKHRTQSAVARQFHCTQQAVNKILDHYRSTGDTIERHAGGRVRIFSDEDLQILSRLIELHRAATSHHLNELLPAGTPHVSDRTIRDYRRELGFTRRSPAIHVIDTAAQIADRRVFARQHKSADPANYVFMDESTLVLRDTGVYVWVRRGESTPEKEITSLRAAVHVWGAIWNEGAVFAQYSGHLSGEKYIEILEENLLRHRREFKGKTFLHDQASFHRANIVKAWFPTNKFDVELLPTHSPQFNPIEYVWAWVKAQVRAQEPDTPASLAESMEKACDLLPEKVRRNFIRHSWNNIRDTK
jgi:transposase